MCNWLRSVSSRDAIWKLDLNLINLNTLQITSKECNIYNLHIKHLLNSANEEIAAVEGFSATQLNFIKQLWFRVHYNLLDFSSVLLKLSLHLSFPQDCFAMYTIASTITDKNDLRYNIYTISLIEWMWFAATHDHDDRAYHALIYQLN